MTLFESVKNFLSKEKEIKTSAEEVPNNKIMDNFTDQDVYSTGAFFDDDYRSIFSSRDKANQLDAQKTKIMLYRNIAKTEEVADAIDEIVNEIVYSENNEILKMQLNEENEKIQGAVEAAFKKITTLINTEKNMYNIVRQSYIDGQIILHCEYHKELSKGLAKIKMIEPIYFYYDAKKEVYKYQASDNSFLDFNNIEKNVEYPKEEIIRRTYGLAEGTINLSYLDYGIKTANQLKILEDLLIPMRFSRSISRRVFNVDTGELSPAKSKAAMQEMSKEFKYKKFYDTNTGEITNQQHITSMVEDYWFANRSGGKGTTVDVLDETGNLGEVNDILYFQKKLYRSLKIPLGRIADNPNAPDMDYDSSSIPHDEMKFFLFVNRIRKIYTEIFKELLRRELISTGVMSVENYDEYSEKISIIFSSENIFVEKMKLANFSNRLELYATAQEYAGKLFPVESILKDIFKMTDEEIDQNFEKIKAEESNPMFSKFYTSEDQ